MKKPVLGIIAVICLQIGFVIYTANERSNDTALKAQTGPGKFYPPATPPIVSTPDRDDASTSENGKDISPPAVRTRSAQRQKGTLKLSRYTIRKEPPVRTRVAAGDSSYANARREPAMTTVKKGDAGRSDDRRPDASASGTKPASKSRSFVARVLPILKKPYDWLKAIGSKLR